MSFYWRVGFGISEHFDPLIIFSVSDLSKFSPRFFKNMEH